jgi:hypothetical protein
MSTAIHARSFHRPRPGERRTDIPTDPGALLDVEDVQHLHRMHYREALKAIVAAGGFRYGRRLVVRRGDLDLYVAKLAQGVA